MAKHFFILTAMLPVLLLTWGCSPGPRVATLRTHPTSLQATAPVTVLLAFYGDCEESGETTCFETYSSPAWDKDSSPGREEQLAGCLYDGISKVNQSAVLLSPKEGRIRFLAAGSVPPGAAGVEMTLKALKSPADPAGAGGYIVLMTMATKAVNKRVEFGAGGYMWALGREWTRVTSCSADVIDVGNSRLAGTITSSAQGTSLWGLPFLIIFPLPPFAWYAGTEDKACRALGEAIGLFLTGVDTNLAE